MGKAACPTGVVIEIMKASGGFGTRWMADLINNIVKDTIYSKSLKSSSFDVSNSCLTCSIDMMSW